MSLKIKIYLCQEVLPFFGLPGCDGSVLSMIAYSGLALLTNLQVLTSLTTQDSKFVPFLFVMVFIKCRRARWKLTLLVPCRITSFSALFKLNTMQHVFLIIQFPEFVNLKIVL